MVMSSGEGYERVEVRDVFSLLGLVPPEVWVKDTWLGIAFALGIVFITPWAHQIVVFNLIHAIPEIGHDGAHFGAVILCVVASFIACAWRGLQ